MSNKAFKVFIGLLTAPAIAFALDALLRNKIGISDQSIVFGSLESAGCLTVVLAFVSVTRRNPK
jgi:hypothetical protein